MRRAAPRPRLGARRLTLLLTACLLVAGCGGSQSARDAIPHDELLPGLAIEADLDGDGSMETVLLDPSDHTLAIDDGADSYRSRDRWRVIQAALGDTDGDGLPEVIALLDSQAGRHLGLFAYFGGVYRERLVSQPLDPAPTSFRVDPRRRGRCRHPRRRRPDRTHAAAR